MRWKLVAIALVVGLCAVRDPATAAFADLFQVIASLGGLAFLLGRLPTRREVVLLAAGASVILPVHQLIVRRLGLSGVDPAVSLLLAIGLSSTGVLALRAARRDADAEDRARLLLALVVLAFATVMKLSLVVAVRRNRWLEDGVLLALDGRFGGQASFAVGRFAADHPGFEATLLAVYVLLPLALSAVVSRALAAGPAARGVLTAFVLAGAAGFLLYGVCPAVGPGRLLGAGFPRGPVPTLSLSPLDGVRIMAPRNCMPSLHTGWALLLCWHTRRFGLAWRLAGAAWLGLTLVATLGLGEHYLVDLIVALPFAVLVDALVHRAADRVEQTRRRTVMAASGAFLVAWYAVLLTAPVHLASRPLVVALAIATVALCWPLHARWSAARTS